VSERVSLVTGGTSGVGLATALGLAKAGLTVVLVTRSEDRGRRSCDHLAAATGNTKCEYIVADLSSMDSVRSIVRQFTDRHESLHVLSNNAALLTFAKTPTTAGLDPIIAINYLSHFLLTNLLLDLLKKSAPSRIVTVSGQPGVAERAGYPEKGLLDLPAGNPFSATVRAMFAKVLFTRELARRIAGSGVTANTFHPGLVRSNLGGNLPLLLRIPYRLANLLLSPHCPTAVYLALDPEVSGANGEFFVNSKAVSFNAPEHEKELASRLWDESVRLSGLA